MNHLTRQKEYTVQSTVFTTGKGQYRDGSFCYAYKKSNRRNGKYRPTSEAQQRVNEKNARYELTRLIQDNFAAGEDLFVHPTFDDEHLPKSKEEFKKIVRNFINRIKKLYVEQGIIKNKGDFKYVYTYSGGGDIRKHWHIVMMGCKNPEKRGVIRDAVENIWSEYYNLGYCNADKLKANLNDGFIEAAQYMCDNYQQSKESGENITTKRWVCSRNLKRPAPACRNGVLAVSLLPKLASASDFERKQIIEGLRMFKGYRAVEVLVSELKDAPEDRKHRIYGNYYIFVRTRKKTVEELKAEKKS